MSQPSFLQLVFQRKLAYPYSLFFGFSCGSLLTLWLTAYVVNQGQHFQYRHVIDSFGQAMASMAARQAMDATLNHDRLSLQILLEDITLHNAIVSAAIYDVENKMIVQAGETGSQSQSYIQYFNAPIALHDTISGQVMLAIDTTHPNGVRYIILFVLITGLLAVSALFFLYRGIGQVQSANNKEIKWPTDGHQKSNDDSDCKKDILLTLEIKNIDELYQKVNNDSRKKIISQLFQHIQKALSLYNGTLICISSNALVLSFKQSSCEQHNAIFNAVCCGYIIRELDKTQSNFTLMLDARVHHTPAEMTVNEQLLLLRHNNVDGTATLAIESVLLKDNDLESYLLINCEENHLHFINIQGFQTTYAELLDNQIKHLLRC